VNVVELSRAVLAVAWASLALSDDVLGAGGNSLTAMTATERRSDTSARKRTEPRSGSVGEVQGTRRAARHLAPSWSPVHRCREHIDALYLLAYLYTGQHDIAEDVVVDVVARSATHRAMLVGGTPWVWHILAEQIHSWGGQRLLRLEAGDELPMARAGLSPPQREALALVVAGRRAGEAAVLLGITTMQIHRDLLAALQGLGSALRAAGPGNGTP
jgi:DNA-directed RNA polymerase specialized sigma24 family protein